jgi:uncharacterized cupin superfamily protein/predicted GNAT family acetyltransferase
METPRLESFMKPYSEYIKSQDELETLKTDKIGVHWVKLAPEKRSSYPHAESLEEEFAFVISGRPHVWINGYIYQLEPGMFVGFPAGTGIAHSFINNASEVVEMVVLGERTKKENRYYYAVNPELKEQHKDFWWEDAPAQTFGPHDGLAGNLNHQRDWQEQPCIQNLASFERKGSYSYPGDSETFSEGISLSKLVGLKALAVWHELMKSGKRSSWPHAHRAEEEFGLILKGQGKAWLNGFVYDVKPGDGVHFKAGTNIAHTLMNEENQDLEFIGIGLTEDFGKEEKIFYPLHETRNEGCKEEGWLWEKPPVHEQFGSHPGIPKVTGTSFEFLKDNAEFMQKMETFLYEREAEYNLLLGLAGAIRQTPDMRYFIVSENQKLIGGGIVTERNLVLSQMPEPFLLPLAQFLKENDAKFPGVVGPAQVAENFARYWKSLTGQAYDLAMGQKIYQLDQVTMPTGVEGRLIKADESHVDLVTQWMHEFREESLPHEIMTIEENKGVAARFIKNQAIFLWLDTNDQPVSMDLIGRATKHGVGVSGVYTPKSARKRGYASAVVAHTSQQMLDGGKKFCVLYTDTANPTSNKIYQQIGYKEVATSKNYLFKP